MNATPTLNNVEVVQAFLAAQYAGEFDRGFASYVNPEFTWVVGTDNNAELRQAIPWAGHRHNGKAGYMQLTQMLFSEFEVLGFEPSKFTDAGDAVYVEGHFKFRHRETGKVADSDWLSRFDMKNGRISSGQFYENTQAVAAARQ